VQLVLTINAWLHICPCIAPFSHSDAKTLKKQNPMQYCAQFSSPQTSQLKKNVEQADNTDCLEVPDYNLT
jgi:hypothetical protein